MRTFSFLRFIALLIVLAILIAVGRVMWVYGLREHELLIWGAMGFAWVVLRAVKRDREKAELRR